LYLDSYRLNFNLNSKFNGGVSLLEKRHIMDGKRSSVAHLEHKLSIHPSSSRTGKLAMRFVDARTGPLARRFVDARLKKVFAPFREMEKKVTGLPKRTDISTWMIPFKMDPFKREPKAATAEPEPAINLIPVEEVYVPVTYPCFHYLKWMPWNFEIGHPPTEEEVDEERAFNHEMHQAREFKKNTLPYWV
jgi:hypothetical protein